MENAIYHHRENATEKIAIQLAPLKSGVHGVNAQNLVILVKELVLEMLQAYQIREKTIVLSLLLRLKHVIHNAVLKIVAGHNGQIVGLVRKLVVQEV